MHMPTNPVFTGKQPASGWELSHEAALHITQYRFLLEGCFPPLVRWYGALSVGISTQITQFPVQITVQIFGNLWHLFPEYTCITPISLVDFQSSRSSGLPVALELQLTINSLDKLQTRFFEISSQNVPPTNLKDFRSYCKGF